MQFEITELVDRFYGKQIEITQKGWKDPRAVGYCDDIRQGDGGVIAVMINHVTWSLTPEVINETSIEGRAVNPAYGVLKIQLY